MSELYVAESVLAIAIAFAFAAFGEILLDRRSASLQDWNESFLTGGSAAATMLFPLSLLLQGRALLCVMSLVGFAAISKILLRRIAPPSLPGPPREQSQAWDMTGIALFLLIAVCTALFAALNWRSNLQWDGFQIWATKAQVLLHEGRLTTESFDFDAYNLLGRTLSYPPLVPLYEAVLSFLRGAFDFNRLKPIFLIYYCSMLLSTYWSARSLLGRNHALAAVALLAALPAVSTSETIGGYADLPLAAYLAGAVCALVRRPPFRIFHPAAWILAGLLMVKNEGIILFVLGVGGIVAYWFLQDLVNPKELAVRHRASIAVLVAAGLVRFSYVRWVNATDLEFGANFARAAERVGAVVSTTASFALSLESWGLFWPAFFLAALFIFLTRETLPVIIAGTTFVSLIAFSAIFLFTNWDMAVHIKVAYPRLLVEIAPIAALTIVLGLDRGMQLSGHPRQGLDVNT